MAQHGMTLRSRKRSGDATTDAPAAPEATHERWQGPIGVLGGLLFSVNPTLPVIPAEESKIFSTWYISPEQTILEVAFVSAIILYSFYGISQGIYLKGWDYVPVESRDKVDMLDEGIKYLTAVEAAVLVGVKLKRNRAAFLLQPCNIWIVLLAYLGFQRDAVGAWLFNFYLHTMWGSWLGMLAADLRDYQSLPEIVLFFLVHITLIALPFYHLTRGNFPVYPQDPVGTYGVLLAVHWWCYLPFSIVSGWHIQYMTHPPSQLKKHGGLYRMVGLIGYFIFTLITSAGVTWYTSSASPEA